MGSKLVGNGRNRCVFHLKFQENIHLTQNPCYIAALDCDKLLCVIDRFGIDLPCPSTSPGRPEVHVSWKPNARDGS